MRNVFEYIDGEHLEHKNYYKYDRKEFKNGKWVYYYKYDYGKAVKDAAKTVKPYITGKKSLGFKERRAWKKAGNEWQKQRDDGKLAWVAEAKMFKANYDYFKTPLGKLEEKIYYLKKDFIKSIDKKISEIDLWFRTENARRELKKAQRTIRKEANKTQKEIDSFFKQLGRDANSFLKELGLK